jgi:hypothetical protein
VRRSHFGSVSEAYSVYYLGKIPDGHPLAPWLDKQTPDDKRPANRKGK